MNAEYIKVNGRTFVTCDDDAIKEVETTPDLPYKLILENINEALIEKLINKYAIAISTKEDLIKSKKNDLKFAQGESKKSNIYKIIASALFLLAFGAIIGVFGMWTTSQIDTFNLKEIISAYANDSTIFNFSLGLSSVAALGSAVFLLRNFCYNKKRAAILETEISSLEADVTALNREMELSKKYAETKETTSVEFEEEHSLREFNESLDTSLASRFSKIQNLQDIKASLVELFNGSELDSMLITAGMKPEEIQRVKETMGKRLNLMPQPQTDKEE